MKYFCPFCWRETSAHDEACPHCGKDIATGCEARSYSEKLLAALRHPEPQTVRRVVWILGEQQIGEAVAPLLDLLRSAPDIYLAAAICEALGRIGGSGALPDLQFRAGHGSVIVRRAARRALERMKNQGPPGAYDR